MVYRRPHVRKMDSQKNRRRNGRIPRKPPEKVLADKRKSREEAQRLASNADTASAEEAAAMIAAATAVPPAYKPITPMCHLCNTPLAEPGMPRNVHPILFNGQIVLVHKVCPGDPVIRAKAAVQKQEERFKTLADPSYLDQMEHNREVND